MNDCTAHEDYMSLSILLVFCSLSITQRLKKKKQSESLKELSSSIDIFFHITLLTPTDRAELLLSPILVGSYPRLSAYWSRHPLLSSVLQY